MQIQHADIGYRRRVVRTLSAVVLLLLAALIGTRFWLASYIEQLQPDELPGMIALLRFACFALIAVCIAALGGHLLLRGGLIVRDRRFPPRDARAVRDTPVREGADAVRLGRASQLGGFACLVAAVLVVAAAWLLNARF